ncbi:MAG: hypothetical protein AB8B82_00865 [Roseovarius sp.]
MAWMNGTLFTKKEDAETIRFLSSIGLNENQGHAVSIWHKSQLSGQLNLWVGLAAPLGVVLGLILVVNI